MEHSFTLKIKEILEKYFPNESEQIIDNNFLLQYINDKTRSAGGSSKSRGSFANLYAIYVLVEDYIQYVFHQKKDYTNYEGAPFMRLFNRQRELPFGSKLQNHGLNNRANSEFKKLTPEFELIIRDQKKNRYWINANLLDFSIGEKKYNIAKAVKEIIEKYADERQQKFNEFRQLINEIRSNDDLNNTEKYKHFISDLLSPKSDARIFEIISYSILKYFYNDQKVYFGFEITKIKQERLELYKTGRTNANDGGIDFVMKPLGRFFQVTESYDVSKYFLDIDKVEHYPITFVIKSEENPKILEEGLRDQAKKRYSIEQIINKYMLSIEEIINVPILLERLQACIDKGYIKKILYEIEEQSKLEFINNTEQIIALD